MKTYETDNNLNYDDLVEGDISETKGYGPCAASVETKTLHLNLWWFSKISLTDQKKMTVYNVDNAREEASEIIRGTGYWNDSFSNVFSATKRRRLANRINDAIDEHINYGKYINRVVDGDEDDDGGGSGCNQS